ncbi:MAG: sodium/glutamate symporter [Planctomycetota bacterium]
MLVAISLASILLLVGLGLRQCIPALRWCMIPASIVGGFLGLGLIQIEQRIEWPLLYSFGDALVAEWSSWPGLLIAVVFACMFLERRPAPLKSSLRPVLGEGLMVWIVVFGQTAVGLLCTWLLIQPFYDVPNSFAVLIETGFAGGHGTASAMGTVFEHPAIDLEGGRDLGLFMATAGLVFSVVSGLVYANIARRQSWLNGESEASSSSEAAESEAESPNSAPVEIESDQHDDDTEQELNCYPTIARGRVAGEAIDPFAFQVAIVALAFGIGFGLKSGVSYAIETFRGDTIQAQQADALVEGLETTAKAPSQTDAANEVLAGRTSVAGTLGDLPLFIYTLFGGILVRRCFAAFGIESLLDDLSIQRISGVTMDFLIVAAIASLRIEVVTAYATPLLILLGAAILWTGFCLVVLSRYLLPKDYWFELGILNYGMSTGTTATGFTLLKTVDQNLRTSAARDYAMAAPLSAPFVGGGMLTVGLPLLLLERLPIAVSTLSALAILIALVFVARWLVRSG